jgi:hypothetical protein
MLRLTVLYVGLFALALFFPSAPHSARPPSPPDLPEGMPVQWEEPPDMVRGDEDERRAGDGPETEWVVSGRRESIPLLVRYLKGQEEIVQLAALAEFAGMGAKARSAVPVVLEALHDPRCSIRLEAAATLIHLHAQKDVAVRALVDELKAKDAGDRVRAAGTIGRLVRPLAALGTSCWGPDPPPQIARPWVGRRTLPALVEALGDREPKVRAQAAQIIGLIGRDGISAAPALAKALKDEDATVRAAAARSLKKVKR